MVRQLIVFLVFTVCLQSVSADALQLPSAGDTLPPAAPAEEKKNVLGPVLTIGLLVVAAGTGGYFLYRRAQRERQHGDSIIAAVEQAWDSASVLYADEEYPEAIHQLHSIAAYWHEYEKYSTRYRQRRHVDPDSIKSVIASCDFLESMIPPIQELSRRAERLPEDEFALSRMSRSEILTLKESLRKSMDSILVRYPNHRNGLSYSMRHIRHLIHQVDSLQEASYSQRKKDFVLKNRFYYNRAMESGDTADMRGFLEDCDYYQVDKEWCQRVRLALSEYTDGSPAVLSPPKKMSSNDSIRYAYKQAMQSKQVEVLEEYIEKYSSRKYRRKRRIAKIDSVKNALRVLQREIDAAVAFNKSYPRFGNADVEAISVTIRGLSSSAEEAFNSAWEELKPEVAKLPSIRLPASLTVDYTAQPPALLFDAMVSPEQDFERLIINDRKAFKINALFPTVSLLNQCKRKAVEELRKVNRKSSKNNTVMEYLIQKISLANYILRLRKPRDKGTIIFYAKETINDIDSTSSVTYYDFYDLSTRRRQTTRFPIYPTTLPNVIPALSADPLELEMGTAFFEE